ncbi:MAG: nucleoside monophosphate kinase [Parcubacteria group bacterium]|nr:nucleoside monophosphate kinase [Parcubacteria group bacterium]
MKDVFLFIGRSGSGKGTQAERLAAEREKTFPDRKFLSLGTGKEFRDFITHDGYTAQLAKEIYDRGGLQPEFLVTHIWSHFFIQNLTGEEDLILDGMPRKIHEAYVLESAFDFYRARVFVIFLNVSRAWSFKLLTERGRVDDTANEINKRLDWYETDVEPVVQYYRAHPRHAFLDINGEQTRDAVQAEIARKLAST